MNEVLERNTDTTIHNRSGTTRKTRSMSSYENLFMDAFFTPTFGSSLFHSLLNGFSSIFEWVNLPDEIKSEDIEKFLISSGRVKMIYVNDTYYVVHISPIKWDHYFNTIESRIIEPYLGRLNGKITELFPNVEIKNNSLGMSLIRQIFPFIETIDEALFNLDINMKILSGKFILLTSESVNTPENRKEQVSVNQWLINGEPVKVMERYLTDESGSPLISLDVKDSTESFIQTIRFMISQLLNVIGVPNDNFEDKKERKITSEINVQNILQSSIIEDMLNWRKIGAKNFNKTFDLNIEVKVKDAYTDRGVSTEEGNDDDVL